MIKYETITVDAQGQPIGTLVDTVTVHQTVTTPVPQPASASLAATAVVAGNVLQNAQVSVAPTTKSTTTTPIAASTSSPVQQPATTAAPVTTSSPITTPKSSTSPVAAVTSAPSASSGGTAGLALQAGSVANPLALGVAPSQAFQDGTIDCTSFPSQYQGVVDLSYLGSGGYTGIQLNDGSPSACQEGALCSYACQPGMLKSQWPTSQPADGQSRGGLLCQGGKLYLSDSSKPYPCIWGQASAFVQSSLSQGVAICQTDYPGTENMVIPTWVAPGASAAPLAVANEDTYYQWQGKKTSSQFYVNNAGVSQQDGCQWGSSSNGFGNYAPLNIGAGYTGGISWLSMFPNPNAISKLNFNVKFVAGSGSNMNGECWYENGVFGGASATANGCTVACTGTCYYQFY